jgi:RES domain-containing protein
VIRARPLDGRFWRILSPRWAHDPLSGAGAARHGGRWNRPGAPALYLSAEVETAFAEYQQEIGTRPGTFVAYEVAGARVYDLTRAPVREKLDLPEAAMFAPWKKIAFVDGGTPPSWAHADLLARHADGVLVPSAMREGGTNLVLWRWNEAGVVVRFHDPKGDLGPGRA